MTVTVRRLTDADAAEARRLGFEAFGVPTVPPPELTPGDPPGRAAFGAFDGTTLAGKMVDRDFDSYFGGASLPTAGVAGVTVAAEYRGQGVLTPLFAETLSAARARGAVLSTLFPTAPRIYRRFGYEVVADFRTVEVPAQSLAAVVATDEVWTRRATVADVESIRRVYDAWAVEQNGPLTRRGVSFSATPDEFLADVTGVTLAVDAQDSVHGYVSWRRGQGYGEEATLEVIDLLAVDAAGYRALLRTVGSFSSVTARVRIDTSGDDLARTFLPSLHWQVKDSSPYMLKVLDVSGALTLRHYPPGFSDELAFQLVGDVVADNNGGYLLDVSNGRGSCVRADHGGRTFTPQGLALMFAGAQSSANLRAIGQLSGGVVEEDATWDAHFGGRQAHIRNYF